MRGKYKIIVENKRIRYDFEIRRNLTILQGNSATGKTTLVDMIQEYYENGAASGIKLHSEKECAVLVGRNWKSILAVVQDSIVFIDEGNEFVLTDEFAAAIQKTDNYYVIVIRGGIPSLPYSIEEIYGIHNSGKYGILKKTYNEFFHLYHMNSNELIVKPEIIITEDSNSGYQFFYGISHREKVLCVSANGKSNIFSYIIKMLNERPNAVIMAVADGAAFGAEMEIMRQLILRNKNLILYLPESFEWLILQAGIIDDKELQKVLEAPEEYIESQKYFSCERFFTALLIERTNKTYLKYSKQTLNLAYLKGKVRDKILKVIKKVEF